jgi:hypothetical protein
MGSMGWANVLNIPQKNGHHDVQGSMYSPEILFRESWLEGKVQPGWIGRQTVQWIENVNGHGSGSESTTFIIIL